MKKIMTGIVIGCFSLAMATSAIAEQKEQVNVVKDNKLVKSVVFIEGKSEYFVDGKTPGVKMDAAPYISQSRTFVPVRYLGNALGVVDENIAWDTSASKAKLVLGTKSAELIIGQKQILASGQAKAVDVAPELRSGRTYLPARFVAEALGYQVEFVNGLVVCYPEGAEKPDVSAVQQYLGQQQPQPPVQQEQGETKNLNGYTVPVKTKTDLLVKYGEEERTSGVEINLAIIIPNRDVSKQCDEAEQILASKFGKDFAKKVVDVARSKTTQLASLGEKFTGPNGETVRVISSYGGTRTSIAVWTKGE